MPLGLRDSCLDCVRKHLAQALVLDHESHQGYPQHRWYAVGHLAEAADECVAEHPALAKRIRAERIKLMEDPKHRVRYGELIAEATRLAGGGRVLIQAKDRGDLQGALVRRVANARRGRAANPSAYVSGSFISSGGAYLGLGQGGADVNPPTMDLDLPAVGGNFEKEFGGLVQVGSNPETGDPIFDFKPSGSSWTDSFPSPGEILKGVGGFAVDLVKGIAPSLVGAGATLITTAAQKEIAEIQARAQGALASAQERLNDAKVRASLEATKLQAEVARARTEAEKEVALARLDQQNRQSQAQVEMARAAQAQAAARAREADAAAAKAGFGPNYGKYVAAAGVALTAGALGYGLYRLATR